MTEVVIWTIGYFFTVYLHDAYGRSYDSRFGNFAMFFGWPGFLGDFVGSYLRGGE